MSRVPGSFLDSEEDSGSDIDHEELSALAQAMDTTDDSEGDLDYTPVDDEEMTIDGMTEDDGEAEEEEEEEEEEAEGGGGAGGGGLQIAYDAATRQILIVSNDGTASRLTQNHLTGSSITLSSLRAMLEARFGGRGGAARRRAGGDDDEEDDDDDDDEDDGSHGWWGPPRPAKKWYPDVLEPIDKGVKLERSGEWGPPPASYLKATNKFHTYSPNLTSILHSRSVIKTPARPRFSKTVFSDAVVPNHAGTEVAQFTSKVYSGQYSDDGSFFYAGCQDFRIYIYDTRFAPLVGSKSVTDNSTSTNSRYDWQHRSSLKVIKTVKAHDRNSRWTITDANVSKDNEWLIYSSITPRVHLVRTGRGGDWENEDHDQATLDFSGDGAASRGLRSDHFGIWSIRFSQDGKEIIAGANTGGTSHGQLFVYDVEADRPVLRVRAHTDDVNGVAFADDSSPNLLLSGSDDTFVKVWDRRSLSGERASGVLVGHTEGITFVAPKGDGRYCLSNGKDQCVKLWDIRMMMSDQKFDDLKLARIDYGIPGWDYRESYYRKPAHKEHPHDVSVMTYRGHAVLRTLIRCHFSPAATTDQRYVYSGSADGKIHIWSLDGRILQVLDRRHTRGLINNITGDYNDPMAPDISSAASSTRRNSSAVRDVSWHPYEPTIMSTAWEGQGHTEGSLAMHQWRSKVVGETLEDQVLRSVEEARG